MKFCLYIFIRIKHIIEKRERKKERELKWLFIRILYLLSLTKKQKMSSEFLCLFFVCVRVFVCLQFN